MPIFSLFISFSTVIICLNDYFTAKSHDFLDFSPDILWIPVLLVWANSFWNAATTPKTSVATLRLFAITPSLALFTVGVTQFHLLLWTGLYFSQSQMLEKAHTLKSGTRGNGTIKLFKFKEIKSNPNYSVYVLDRPSNGDQSGFLYSVKPFNGKYSLFDNARIMGKPSFVGMGSNWSYWQYKYDPF